MKRISIWGTGSAGKRMYSYLKIRTEIVCFYDSAESKIGTFIEGVPVKRWRPTDSSVFIVIASSFYEEIVPLLMREGLEIFKDFTLYEFIKNPYLVKYKTLYRLQRCMGVWKKEDWMSYKGEKEILVIHGGCHAEGLANLLSLHTQFREKYKIILSPHIMSGLVYQGREANEMSEYCIKDDNFWEAVDVFLYQLSHIWPGFIDPHTLMLKLSENCKKYVLSPLEFFGYFPQCRDRLYKIFCSCRDINLIYDLAYPDRYINKLYYSGKTVDEIIAVIGDEKFLPEDEVLEFFRVSLSLLQAAEDGVDIKIYDYVEKFGRERQLFADPAHPGYELLMEYANRIADFLIPGCDLVSSCDYQRVLQGVYLTSATVPVYPCVCKALGLGEYFKRFYIVRGISFTPDEYVREYVRVLAYNEAQKNKRVRENENEHSD